MKRYFVLEKYSKFNHFFLDYQALDKLNEEWNFKWSEVQDPSLTSIRVTFSDDSYYTGQIQLGVLTSDVLTLVQTH